MRKNINIDNDLDLRIREYTKKYNITYTSFVNRAIESYLLDLDMVDNERLIRYNKNIKGSEL